MTFQDMLEQIRLHHPTILENEIRVSLNYAQDDFRHKTDILKSTYTQPTVANQRWYLLNAQILTIKSVEIDNVQIPRFVGDPPITDMDN